MFVPLSQAPYDSPLIFEQVTEPKLAQRFVRLGISRGDVVLRMSEEARACPVRVRTPKGEAVLATGMASKVIVHHDDGHKTPIAEMKPGESGHVEGVVCSPNLEQGLAVLGIENDAAITMLRVIPPMDYIALFEGSRMFIPQGAAAKIWGKIDDMEMQFAVARRDSLFSITKILGGERAVNMLTRMGLTPGAELRLSSVRPAPGTSCVFKDQTVLATRSGLRLYLRPDLEERILVEAP